MVKRHYQIYVHSSVKEPNHGSLIYFGLKIEGPKAAKDGKDTHTDYKTTNLKYLG